MGLNKREIVLFHTNDIHSQLDNVAKIATILEQYREQYNKEEILLVDLGDFMDRMRLETEGTDGLVHRDLLNSMQYDVITLGNNEGLSFTHEQLTHIYQAPTTFKVVCSNMSALDGQHLDWLFKSTIIEKNGLKVAFIGVTINYTDFYKLLNWNAADPIAAVIEQVESLREQADVVVVLSHLGIRLDEQLVEACSGIDVLIGAHTHHVFNPAKMQGDTLMCAGGMSGAYLGVVHISAADESKQKLQLSGTLIPTAEYEQHKEILHILEHHKAIALSHLDKEVAVLNKPLYADDFIESQLPNLLAISLRQWCGTSLSIVNSGQIISSLEAGRVTLRDIHTICPSPINPCILKIKGIHIREALEQSVEQDYRAKVIKGYGFRGNRLGYLAVSGIKIEYKLSNSENISKFNIFIQNKPLVDDEIYSVASIDMFTFGIGYTSLSQYEDVNFFVPEYIRHLLANTLTNAALIEESKQSNWLLLT